MSFSFQCPVCKSVREAADNLYGKRVRCADCTNFVVIDDSTIVTPGSTGDIDYGDGGLAAQNSDDPISPVPAQPVPAQPVVAQPVTAQPIVAQPVPAQPVTAQPVDSDKWRTDSNDGSGGDGTGTESGDGEFEPVNLPKGEKRTDDEMDMTPMVDVTFLLLIFFMVTASFTLQKSMDLPTKTQDEPSTKVVEEFEDNQEYVSVFVSPFNEYRVRTSEYDWEDAPNRHELGVKLRDALEAQSRPEKMLIMAHAESAHDKVIQAMDIGIELQYKIQVIMTEEEF